MQEHSYGEGGILMNFAEGPDNGPPLVLLHGGSLRWQAWDPVIDGLAERTHVFAIDLRGHGRSGWTPGRYRLFDYVGDVAAFVRDVVGDPAILLGHSLGGEVALITAALHPSSVLAVIDEDGPLSCEGARRVIMPTRPMLLAVRELAGSTLPDDELTQRVADVPIGFETGQIRRFGDVVGDDEDILAWFAETFRNHDPTMIDAVIEFEEMHASYDGDELLPLIASPTVILQADPACGGALTDGEVDHGISLLRNGHHIRGAGLGHSMHLEDPNWFLGVVSRAITDLIHPQPGPIT